MSDKRTPATPAPRADTPPNPKTPVSYAEEPSNSHQNNRRTLPGCPRQTLHNLWSHPQVSEAGIMDHQLPWMGAGQNVPVRHLPLPTEKTIAFEVPKASHKIEVLDMEQTHTCDPSGKHPLNQP